MKNLLAGAGRYRVNRTGKVVKEKTIVALLMYKAYAAFPKPQLRRPFLEDVVDGFYERILDPKSPSKLLGGLGLSLDTKHMQMWMRDPAEQGFIEKMNWDASIERAEGDDYLYLVEQNVGGNKLDYYSEQTTSMDISFEGADSLVTTEARVHNGVFLPSRGSLWGDTKTLQAGNVHRPMLNLYVQPDAELIEAEAVIPGGDETCPPLPTRPCRIDISEGTRWVDGLPATHLERGKKVWSGTLQIPPQQEAAFRYRYRVPGVVHESGDRSTYRLQVQSQPKAHPETLEVSLTFLPEARSVKAPGFKRKGSTSCGGGHWRRTPPWRSHGKSKGQRSSPPGAGCAWAGAPRRPCSRWRTARPSCITSSRG